MYSKQLLIFQSVNNIGPDWWPEHQLPVYLSKYSDVSCFEFPQWKKVFLLLTSKIPLIDKRSNRLKIYHSFGLLPFGRSFSLINNINHKFNYYIFDNLIRSNFQKVISFTPEFVYTYQQMKKSFDVYYFVTDEYLATPYWSNPLQRRQFIRLEAEMLKISKKVITVSNTLYNKYKKLHNNVIYFPTPVNISFLNDHKVRRFHKPSDIKNISKPIIGMVGSIYDWKIDVELLIKMNHAFSKTSIVIIGPISFKNFNIFNSLLSKNNVYYLGIKRHEEILKYISSFDICIIPYLLNQHIIYGFPMKISEYLFMGKPIITTAIPAIKYLGDKKLIYWSKNDTEFIKNIHIALNEKKDPQLIKKRVEEGRKNDWDVKIREFIKILLS